MCDEYIKRSLIFALTFLAATSLPGCWDRTTGGSPAANGDGVQAAPNGPTNAGVPASGGDAMLNAKSFDTILLASDTSYQSPPIPPGAAAGEVREMTTLKIKFCWCPNGTFQMGSRADDPGTEQNERQFEVSLSRGFWLQQTELTQAEYETLTGINPSYFRGASNPVETVNWTEATEFCRRLSELPPEKNSGNLYRLPTEAEWEYACRAGSTTVFSFGDDEAMVEDYGWFNKNAARTTHPVGGKKPNAWGLHDMHGNVAEWCSDVYGDYPSGSVTDPRGPESGEVRLLRGGGWFFVPHFARSSHRDAYPPTARYVGLGFRLVAEPSRPSSR